MMIGFSVSVAGSKMGDNTRRILACVDRGMGLLGESGRQAVYWQMEKSFGLRHDEIPAKPKEFSATLDSLFGEAAVVIQRSIVTEIAKKFEAAVSAVSLEEAVRAAEGCTG